MKTIIQRVNRAKVTVNDEVIGKIEKGYLALIGVENGDTHKDSEFIANKLINLRLFSDENGKFNYSIKDVNGEILAVSQFTLLGDSQKGRRPSFQKAAKPEHANNLISLLVKTLEDKGIKVATGKFGAYMKVDLENDGPVTLIIDSKNEKMKKTLNPQKDENFFDKNPSKEDLLKLVTGYPRILIDLSLSNPQKFFKLSEDYQTIFKDGVGLLDNEEDYFFEKLNELLLQIDPSKGLQWIVDTGLMKKYIPEIYEIVEFSRIPEKRHKNIWEHTKQVIRQIPNKLDLRYAALFHDIGKIETRSFTDDGKVTFYAHDIIGARIFKVFSENHKIEVEFSKKIYKLIKLHLRPGQYENSWTNSAVRRFYTEIDPEIIDDLLELGKADITSKRPGRRLSSINLIDELTDRIKKLKIEDEKLPLLPKGVGNKIIEEFKIKPGPQIGNFITILKEKIEAGDLEPQKNVDYYIEALKTMEIDLIN
jgi:poly(A) polymerase